MPDTELGKWGTAQRLSNWAVNLCRAGGYAGERLSLGGTGKAAQGQSWSPTGLVRYDRPG